MSGAWRLGVVIGLAGLAAGCSVSGLAPIGPTAAVAPAVAPPVVYGAFLEGPVGQKLSAPDRDRALAAEEAALTSGQRKTWRGEGGAYGYVEPVPGSLPSSGATDGAAQAAGVADTCRDFTSTVYFGGRPQVGHGRGCLNPDGSYRVVG